MDVARTTCRSCGRALPRRTGQRGRASVYCSAACRQRAYRERQAPDADGSVQDLITDVAERARRLAPQPPGDFYADVTALSSSVGRLRRIARTARDAAADSVTPQPVTETGGDADFAGLLETYRRELQVHCYRMTGSYDESEDLVQEVFLKAWRSRETYEGRASLRAWLYRIATNTCLDHLRRHSRRPQPYERLPGMEHGDGEPPSRITWLQPCPDDVLAGVPAAGAGPEAEAESRETVELVFLAALQHLPPRQRAVLILRDVLGLPAAEAAELLELSTASVNSALQRARPALRRHLPDRRTEWSATADPTPEERAVLDRYVDATRRLDLGAMAELLREDARLTMPPNPYWFTGRQAIVDFVAPVLDPASPQFFGLWRHLYTRANGQPAAAGYVQRPGTAVYRAQMLDVLRIEDGRIAEITTFEPHLLPAFGLPLKL